MAILRPTKTVPVPVRCLVESGLIFPSPQLRFRVLHPQVFTARQGRSLVPRIMPHESTHLVSPSKVLLLLARLGMTMR